MVTLGPFLQDGKGDFACLRCWEQWGLEPWRRGEILSSWVLVGDKTWLDGKELPGSPVDHQPCFAKTATSCLQNSSAPTQHKPKHLCLKPASPKVEWDLLGILPPPIPLNCAWWRKNNTVRAAAHLTNWESNRGLSTGDLRDISLDETRWSTLPQHKILFQKTWSCLTWAARQEQKALTGHQAMTWKYSGPNGIYTPAQM